MQIKLVSVLNSVLLSIKSMCYFNPSASPVVFNPLLFSRGVIFTFFAMVFSIRLASNAIFLSVQVISWKVKSTRRYLSLFPTSKKLSQSIWIFFIVMLLHWLSGMSLRSPGLKNWVHGRMTRKLPVLPWMLSTVTYS